jgi:hypothetical protein
MWRKQPVARETNPFPLAELEHQAAERAIANVSKTSDERRLNRRKLAKVLSGRVTHAIDAMAFQGMTVEEAAKHARIRLDNLRRSLKEPVAKAYLAECERQLRDGFRLRALHRTDELAETAKSEHVRLGANKALLNDPEQRKPATNVSVNVGLAVGAGQVIRPGIEIDLSQPRRPSPLTLPLGVVIDCSQPDPRRAMSRDAPPMPDRQHRR